ncbi:MAG: DUF922 domain-containing protein [Aeromonas sp.]
MSLMIISPMQLTAARVRSGLWLWRLCAPSLALSLGLFTPPVLGDSALINTAVVNAAAGHAMRGRATSANAAPDNARLGNAALNRIALSRAVTLVAVLPPRAAIHTQTQFQLRFYPVDSPTPDTLRVALARAWPAAKGQAAGTQAKSAEAHAVADPAVVNAPSDLPALAQADYLVDWHVTLRPTPQDAGAPCYARAFVVSLGATLHLPQWQQLDAQTPAWQARWQRLLGNSLSYEARIKQLLQAGGHQIGQALADVPPAPTCAAFEQAAWQAGQQALARVLRELGQFQQKHAFGQQWGVDWPATL